MTNVLTGFDGVPAVVAGVSVAGARSVTARGAAPDTRFRIASLTKTFTSRALVRALGERGIPLGAPAIEQLPGLTADWRADTALTIEQVLAQVSGLRESVDADTVAALGNGADAITETARLVVRAGSERDPGERWSYYNGNYFLAGAILESVTGAPFEDAIAGARFDPPPGAVAGWDGTEELPPLAYPRGRRPSGGLWASVPELLTLGESLLDDHETRRPRTRTDDPMTYGLGWAIGPSGQMYLNGRLHGYRAAMLLLPDKGYASVVLTNQEHALPAVARALSDLQRDLTGDEMAAAIEGFAA